MRIDHRQLITVGKRVARLAGGVYLLVVVGVTAVRVAVRLGFRVPGTTSPAAPMGAQVRLVDDIALAAGLAFIGGTLYLLLHRVDRQTSGRANVYLAVAVGMITINLLLQRAATATSLLSSTGTARNSGGLVALLLNMHDHGYALAAVVLCLSLAALGHLAYQSARYPIAISVVLTVSLIAATTVKFIWPELPATFHAVLAPPAVVDLWLIAYLVAKGGIRSRRTTPPAATAARMKRRHSRQPACRSGEQHRPTVGGLRQP